MSRRLIIGDDGSGNFKLRQAKPGFDAATAPLSGYTFDADFYPGRILGRNNFYVPGGGANSIHSPGNATVAHGLGKRPDLVVAVAKPMYNLQQAPPFYDSEWIGKTQTIGSSTVTEAGLTNSHMDNQYCAPFQIYQTLSGGNIAPTTWRYGWELHYDDANLTGFYYAPVRQFGAPHPSLRWFYIHVVWIALEL